MGGHSQAEKSSKANILSNPIKMRKIHMEADAIAKAQVCYSSICFFSPPHPVEMDVVVAVCSGIDLK